VVVVYTGMTGEAQKDLVLTQARAAIIRAYLIDNFGFDDTPAQDSRRRQEDQRKRRLRLGRHRNYRLPGRHLPRTARRSITDHCTAVIDTHVGSKGRNITATCGHCRRKTSVPSQSAQSLSGQQTSARSNPDHIPLRVATRRSGGAITRFGVWIPLNASASIDVRATKFAK
jgi:hypothetical protein